MTAADPRTQQLHDSLQSAGLAFQAASDGSPAAALQVSVPDRPLLDVYVRHLGEVVQLVAGGALPGDSNPQLLAERDILSQTWALGRAYFNPITGRWDLALGLRAPGGALPRDALLLAIYQLADAASAYPRGVAPVALIEPRRRPAEVMPRVAEALTGLGLAAREAHGGELLAVRAEVFEFGPVGIELFVDGNGALLMARAQPLGRPPLPESADVLGRLNGLSARLEIGGVGCWYGRGLPFGWVGLPLAFTALDVATVRWCLDTAGQLAHWAYVAAAG